MGRGNGYGFKGLSRPEIDQCLLKQIIKKSVNNGWLIKNPLTGFKCGYVDPDREFLEMDEIMTLYKKKFKVARLSELRDVYVFCCFTGYAYKTTHKLEPEKMYRGIDGKMWVSKDRQKTGSKEECPYYLSR